MAQTDMKNDMHATSKAHERMLNPSLTDVRCYTIHACPHLTFLFHTFETLKLVFAAMFIYFLRTRLSGAGTEGKQSPGHQWVSVDGQPIISHSSRSSSRATIKLRLSDFTGRPKNPRSIHARR